MSNQKGSTQEEVKRIRDLWEDVTKNPFADEPTQWGADTILPEMGPTCDLEELYRDVINKKNMSKYIKIALTFKR